METSYTQFYKYSYKLSLHIISQTFKKLKNIYFNFLLFYYYLVDKPKTTAWIIMLQ